MAKSKLTYRELAAKLDSVMQALQSDELDVDEAIAHYEEGLKLIKQMSEYLKTAENTLTKLQRTGDE